MELLRRLLEGLREKLPFLDDDGLLAALGRERHALHADYVAEMKLLEAREKTLVQFVALEDQLETVGAVVHCAEVHLAHATDHQETSGGGHLPALLELLADLCEIIVRIGPAIGPETELFKFCHRRETILAVFVCLNFHLISFRKPGNYTIFT